MYRACAFAAVLALFLAFGTGKAVAEYVTKTGIACLTEETLKEANQALVSNDNDWLREIGGCYILLPGWKLRLVEAGIFRSKVRVWFPEGFTRVLWTPSETFADKIRKKRPKKNEGTVGDKVSQALWYMFFFFAAIVSAVYASVAARSKNRNVPAWTVLSFFIPVIAPVALILLPGKYRHTGNPYAK